MLFDATGFFDSLLLTQTTDAQHFRMSPLDNSQRVRSEAEFLNAALETLAIDDHVDAERWVAAMLRQAPASAIQYTVEAKDLDSACLVAEERGRALGNLLALHRGAPCRLVAMHVREEGASAGRLYRQQRYSGNLVGGFVSGEDAATLRDHAAAAGETRLLAEWLRHYAEAVSEPSATFAFARYWLLLELMAEALSPDLALADHDAPGGAKEPWRRVVALIRARSAAGRGSAWVVPYDEHLWEATGIWYGYRNAAMHHGGFDANSAAQQRQGWHRSLTRASEQTDADGTSNTLRDGYLVALRETVRIILHWELDAGAGYFDPADPPALVRHA